MSSGAPGVVSALGPKPSVVSPSQIATRVLLGTGRRSVATCFWKRRALSRFRDSRPSPEVCVSSEDLLSRLCVAPCDPCLGSTAARSDAESRLTFQKRKKDGCGETVEKIALQNQCRPSIVENVSQFFLVVDFLLRHAREGGHPRVFVFSQQKKHVDHRPPPKGGSYLKKNRPYGRGPGDDERKTRVRGHDEDWKWPLFVATTNDTTAAAIEWPPAPCGNAARRPGNRRCR